jgi:2-dehydro-3-deoxy-L-rhamnonate dehydrogenase (NAD+)
MTGDAQGIGRAIAERLISSGARVSLWGRDGELVANTAEELGADTSSRVLDQSDFAAVEAARDETEKELGEINILVANAGIAGSNGPVVDYDVEEWRRIVDVKLKGVFYCCKAIWPGMIARGYGRIAARSCRC